MAANRLNFIAEKTEVVWLDTGVLLRKLATSEVSMKATGKPSLRQTFWSSLISPDFTQALGET
jgi:hypothetical protein